MSESGGYKIRKQNAVHFIAFAVVGWIDVFTRREYSGIKGILAVPIGK